ncbi:hypothetical protein K469DRAFT_390873 [Zopfia rhizophila CBS 207.26]|uniref:Uncharacterized protein n=1 Tax=Zopfia rhizophila CBS 207.26 TaxID=1314779 RepID=A0A6A6EKR8_9PEZI|nr:hypothetical protein K469DRAFT_390873 [Zopfia rhizophila CBS 207.26]
MRNGTSLTGSRAICRLIFYSPIALAVGVAAVATDARVHGVSTNASMLRLGALTSLFAAGVHEGLLVGGLMIYSIAETRFTSTNCGARLAERCLAWLRTRFSLAGLFAWLA